jgi:hypothetical protein
MHSLCATPTSCILQISTTGDTIFLYPHYHLNCSVIPHYTQSDVRGKTLATCFNNFQILRELVTKNIFRNFIDICNTEVAVYFHIIAVPLAIIHGCNCT